MGDAGMSCSSRGACCPACPFLAAQGDRGQHHVPSNLCSSISSRSRTFEFWLLSCARICFKPPGQEGNPFLFNIFGISCISFELFSASAGTQRLVPHPDSSWCGTRGSLRPTQKCKAVLHPLNPAPQLLYSNLGLNSTAGLSSVVKFLI